jgi:hypothetical protein
LVSINASRDGKDMLANNQPDGVSVGHGPRHSVYLRRHGVGALVSRLNTPSSTANAEAEVLARGKRI